MDIITKETHTVTEPNQAKKELCMKIAVGNLRSCL